MKSKNGSMNTFIYGKSVGESRYTGSKKKRKTLKIVKKKVIS